MEQLLSPADVAARWDAKADTVRDLIRAGVLPASDISRPGSKKPRYRISPADLLAFEELRKVAPKTATTRRRKKPAATRKFF